MIKEDAIRMGKQVMQMRQDLQAVTNIAGIPGGADTYRAANGAYIALAAAVDRLASLIGCMTIYEPKDQEGPPR